MLSEGGRKKLISILKKRKYKLQTKIVFEARKSDRVIKESDTYEKSGRVGRGTEARNDIAIISACIDSELRALEKITLRIADLEEYRFNGICPECRKGIPLKILRRYPTMTLCPDCQKRKNGKN